MAYGLNSTDGRNGGNMNIGQRKYLVVHDDIEYKDVVIEENINKHAKEVFPNQYIVTCTLR